MAKLMKYGLQLGRVLNGNALIFYQLFLPFHTDEEYEKQANDTLQQKPFYICYRWMKSGALYSAEIAKKMSWYWWRQIKSNLKLNCNHEAKYSRLLCKDDMSKFNYAYKFDYIHKTLVHNHIFTKYFIPEIGKLCSFPPHLTADNFFNSDSILDWMGGLGFGMIGTVAQNRHPKSVEDEYFHKENVSSVSGKRCACVTRLCNPVTMVKEVPTSAEAGRFTKGYKWIHCLFQSTEACNIGSVNSLDSNGLFMCHKERRRRRRGRRKWEIKMNHLQELYLQTYGKLDQIDSVISRSNIRYKYWKYYHAPINRAKALTVPTAFDMYQELTDGTQGLAWLLPKRQQLDSRGLKQKLAKQMLAYNPSDKVYPVDVVLSREVTQSSTKQRLVQSDQRRSCAYFLAKLNGRFYLEFDTEEYKEHHKFVLH
eukprot:jgi/Psemu1/23591/gm1.23591_g